MRGFRIACPTRGETKCEHNLGLQLVQQDTLSVNSPFRMQAIDYGKGHFITARNACLKNALESDADLLLWMDADCAPAYRNPEELYAFLREASKTDGILGARAVRRGGEGWNVLGDDYNAAMPHGVEYIGLDFTAYNLRFFRGAFAVCEREHGGIGCPARMGEPSLPHFYEWRGGMGEDYRACEWVRAHGGQVRLDPRMPTWHDGKVWTGMKSALVMS